MPRHGRRGNDGHNSHANARVIFLISSHLEAGHYFNPHAQRIIEGKLRGAKIICVDPRLSNMAIDTRDRNRARHRRVALSTESGPPPRLSGSARGVLREMVAQR